MKETLEGLRVVLLGLHIAGGTLGLLCAMGALASRKGGKMHVGCGRFFIGGMAVAGVTAVALAVIASDAFLLSIALFSGAQVFAGWRYARLRDGEANWLDTWVTAMLGVVSIWMIWRGTEMLLGNNSLGLALLFFGLIGILLAWRDFKVRRRGAVGSLRIRLHMARMMGGTIAAVTAVMVVNVSLGPPWLVWILPSLVMVPWIFWWARRIPTPAKHQKTNTA